MFSHEDAQKILKEAQTADWLALSLAAIKRELPEAHRAPAYALLNHDRHGKALVQKANEPEASRAFYREIEENLRQFADLESGERQTIFAALVPLIAPTIEAAWQLLGALPYQTGWERKAFRAPAENRIHLTIRLAWLRGIITLLIDYRDKDLAWFAAWTPYLAPYNTQPFGILFAAAINEGGPASEVVFEVLLASARGEHVIGKMGRHVTTGLLVASRPDGWDCIERLLLAAQREEGLRQVILETVDEAHPEAFRRMLHLIEEHDLIRFSATIRAADVWFGFGRTVEDAPTLRNALRAVLPLLDDQAGRSAAIAQGNPQEVYFGLWASAFTNAVEAIAVARPALSDPLPERRLAAVHLLSLLHLPEAQNELLTLLDDPDLRVAIHAFTGIVNARHLRDRGDLFECLQRLLGRLGSKKKTLQSGIWPWLEIPVNPETVLHTMLECLGEREPRCMLAYLPAMSAYDRVNLAKKLVTTPVWDAEIREALYSMVGERGRWVASQVRELLAERPLDKAGVLALENLLTRKDVELRRGLIVLLLKGDDDTVLESAGRLLGLAHILQRLAGLDLLNGLVTKKRQLERAITLASAYRDSHKVLSPEENTLIDTIIASWNVVETPTRENVLGLIEPAQRTPVIQPRKLSVRVDTSAARACLSSLDALIEEQRTTPVQIPTWRGHTEMLLGNTGWHFPRPDLEKKMTEDERERLPLAELWHTWEQERPATQRDEDGLEFFRAALILQTTRAAKTITISRDELAVNELFTEHDDDEFAEDDDDNEDSEESAPLLVDEAPVDATTVPEPEKLYLRHQHILTQLLVWLQRRQGMSPATLNFLLDTTETALASIDLASIIAQATDPKRSPWERRRFRDSLSSDGSRAELEQYRTWYRQQWEPEHLKRYWQLMHWLDEPVPGLARSKPDLDVLMDAYSLGAASEIDILDQLGGPTDQEYRSTYTDLYTLSTRTPAPQTLAYPILGDCVDRLRERILEIELGRGELPTVATSLALLLRYSGGAALFVRLVSLLTQTDLERGYRNDSQNRSSTLSHLLRASYPGADETPEEFARLVGEAEITTERLVAAAIYAPQWARHVEYVLAWPHFVEAVWWIYAHTKGTNWSVEQEIRQIWQNQVAERTTISAEELIDGAVDVAWFWNSYHALGGERWEMVYAAAKYASGGTGHTRARLFADAMLGKVCASTLQQRLFEKRQPDVARALGLVPLATSEQERKDEVAGRYQTFQEFKRTGKGSGAQRRASEEKATRIGLDNLARTAGFADPIRLQWAMEAQTAHDLRDGILTVREDGAEITLKLDAITAEPVLTIVGGTGKILKALPARLKKQPEVIALLARKKEIEQQIRRMRAALETAMCRGEQFTASEILELLAHPVLSRLLQHLIFVYEIDEQGKQRSIAGYPVRDESENEPWLSLRDYAGQSVSVASVATNLRLAHPYDLFSGKAWHNWQHECFTVARAQPFKQVFRELYVCTSNETRNGDDALSERYSGHQVQPRQANALLGQRGWIGDYEGERRRTFHAEKLTAAVTFTQGIFTPSEVEGLTMAHVFFTQQGEYKPMPLAKVPPRVFSETMRDLDLVVSVAHSGGVDPEATASTVEMRTALVNETCLLLGLENVSLKSAHALIEGRHGHYSVHLGSAVVHRQPGGALCIVPVHAQHQGRIFLPFADSDPRTAEVITKIITLARDHEIKDPTILEQIL